MSVYTLYQAFSSTVAAGLRLQNTADTKATPSKAITAIP
jgi:hypothetical protein